MSNIPFAWTDERRTLVKWMWQGGDTASAIAKELGNDLTRAAVMGIIHRNGWQHRILGERHSKAGTRKPRPKDKQRGDRMMKMSPPLQPQPIIARAVDVVPKRISLMELTSDTCRYPLGDVPPYEFCGCEVVEGVSYCAGHARLCYAPRGGERREYIPMRKSR